MDRRNFLVNTARAALVATVSASNIAERLHAKGDDRQTTPIHYLSATEMARRIRKSLLSPVELLDALIQRIEIVNPQLNALIYPDFDRARCVARKCEQAVRAGEVNWQKQPLFGVPFTVKNYIQVEGNRQRWSW